MSQIDLLFQLQQLDQEIRAKRQRLGEVIRAQVETAELLVLRQAAVDSADALRQARVAQRDLELEFDTLNVKIRQSEEHLYSGQVRSSRELADLQASITAMKRQQSGLEEKSIEGLLNLDDLKGHNAAAEAAWQAFSAGWDAGLTLLRQEQSELAATLAELLEQRASSTTRLDRDLLTQYDRIGRKRNGIVVAQLRQNMCLGCRVTVPANTVKAAHEGKIVYCANCDRILKP